MAAWLIQGRFDVAGLERAIGVQAQQVRRLLESMAAKLPSDWSLEIVRGDLIDVVLERGSTEDLLVLGRTRRPAYRGMHGETAAGRGSSASGGGLGARRA